MSAVIAVIENEIIPDAGEAGFDGSMSIIDATGDTEIKWSRRNHVETEVARAAFSSMKGKGYTAYKMTASGAKGEVISAFDPEAERILFMPPMVGG